MANSTSDAEARLQRKASEVVRDHGPAIRQLLADLNKSRLKGLGRLGSAEIGRMAIRWELQWKADPVTYRMHIAVTLADDGQKAFVDRVLVQREASAPYDFQGHTPTTMMKQIATLNVKEIKSKLEELWPR
ncbi:MAG: hypothetical protein HY782_20470 [Chloroflexi bacterium]|nr:hypothetical protein [Chloroflexota bacterium]